jgi:hypothetical protein
MHGSIQETQTSLFVRSQVVTTNVNGAKPLASASSQKVGPVAMAMNLSKPTEMRSSLGASTKMMMGPEKKYSIFNSQGSTFTSGQSLANSGNKVSRSTMQMSATKNNNDSTIIKKAGGQFAPNKYIDQSIEQSKQNIAVEVTLPEETTFEVAGSAPSLAAGHLDMEFGHSCKAIVSPSLLACD